MIDDLSRTAYCDKDFLARSTALRLHMMRDDSARTAARDLRNIFVEDNS